MTCYARTTRWVARKHHHCDDCGATIQPGTAYLEHVAPPGHDDIDNQNWWRIRECADCATRCGRGKLVAA